MSRPRQGRLERAPQGSVSLCAIIFWLEVKREVDRAPHPVRISSREREEERSPFRLLEIARTNTAFRHDIPTSATLRIVRTVLWILAGKSESKRVRWFEQIIAKAWLREDSVSGRYVDSLGLCTLVSENPRIWSSWFENLRVEVASSGLRYLKIYGFRVIRTQGRTYFLLFLFKSLRLRNTSIYPEIKIFKDV